MVDYNTVTFVPVGGSPPPNAGQLNALRNAAFNVDLNDFNNHSRDGNNVLDHVDCQGWRPLAGNPALDPYYMYMGGTSMATPLTAGVVALVRQFYTDIVGITPSGPLLKATLLNGGVDIGLGYGFDGLNEQGWGRVNLTRSVAPCGIVNNKAARCLYFANFPQVDERNPYFNMTLRVSESYPLETTLVWYDPPRNTVAAGGSIVNDLDLIVRDSNNTEYHGNIFIPNTTLSAENPTKRDIINPVERVRVQNPIDGFYNVSVFASYFDPIRPAPRYQNFALVVSGIRGVDSVNETGNYTYNFTTKDDAVYANGVGLPENKSVDIYVLTDDAATALTDGADISDMDISGEVESITSNDEGVIEHGKIWTDPTNYIYYTAGTGEAPATMGEGKYNILIDVDQNHIYNKSTDFLDYSKKVGFYVRAVTATNELGEPKKLFNALDETVYVKAAGLPGNKTVDIYVLKYDSNRNFNNDLELTGANSDIRGEPTTEATDNESKINTTELWHSPGNYIYFDAYADKGDGRYNIVVDINQDGFFNASEDVVDILKVNLIREHLRENIFMEKTDTGASVRELQMFLNAVVEPLAMSDVFDDATEEVLEKYYIRRDSLTSGRLLGPAGFYRISYDAGISFGVPMASSVDAGNFIRNVYHEQIDEPADEKVYVFGSGLPKNKMVDVYVVKNIALTDGMNIPFDVSNDGKNTATTDENGQFKSLMVWMNKEHKDAGHFDIIVDVDRDGKFEQSHDAADMVLTYQMATNLPIDENSGKPEVRELQYFLNNIFEEEVVNVTGIFDYWVTKAALRTYQKSRELVPWGVVNAATYNRIEEDAKISLRIQFVESDKEEYTLGDKVFAFGAGYPPASVVDIFIMPNKPNPRPDRSDLKNIDENLNGEWIDDIDEGIVVDANGVLIDENEDKILIWDIPKNPVFCGEYDIIVDVNQYHPFFMDWVYNRYIDEANRDTNDKVHDIGFVVVCPEGFGVPPPTDLPPTPPPEGGIDIRPEGNRSCVYVGQEARFTATGQLEQPVSVAWSSKEFVISKTGATLAFTPKEKGYGTITATDEQGRNTSISFNAAALPESPEDYDILLGSVNIAEASNRLYSLQKPVKDRYGALLYDSLYLLKGGNPAVLRLGLLLAGQQAGSVFKLKGQDYVVTGSGTGKMYVAQAVVKALQASQKFDPVSPIPIKEDVKAQYVVSADGGPQLHLFVKDSYAGYFNLYDSKQPYEITPQVVKLSSTQQGRVFWVSKISPDMMVLAVAEQGAIAEIRDGEPGLGSAWVKANDPSFPHKGLSIWGEELSLNMPGTKFIPGTERTVLKQSNVGDLLIGNIIRPCG